MTRVSHHGAAARSSRASSRAVARKKKPYKIVLESITQEKKKLRSTVSYSAQAPPGYTFVPAGIPELSEFCKDRCRKRGLEVHVVSAAPKNKAHVDPEKISHHIHRIGHHFPNDIVEQACDWHGYTVRNGVYQKNTDVSQTSRIARALEKHRKRSSRSGGPSNEQETRQQITAAIRDLFPKIPEKDLKAIVKHAFREGTGRVGNAADLSLPRRVQLAVVAHIRHVYTDYDQLLKTGSYLEARAKVEQTCLDRLVKWRGEEKDNDGVVELEDTFREFIVIDDSDDDDSDSQSSAGDVDGRLPSVEITTTQATAMDLQAEHYPPAYYGPEQARYRSRRRAIFVRYPPQPAILHRNPVHPALQPVYRNPHGAPAAYPFQPEAGLSTYIKTPSHLVSHPQDRDGPTVLYSAPNQHHQQRSQAPAYDAPRPYPRLPEQPRLVQESRPPVYSYMDSPRLSARYVEEVPRLHHARQDYYPSQHQQQVWREPGRYYERQPPPLTDQDGVQLYATYRREQGFGERDSVLPSIEASESQEPLPTFHSLRLVPVPPNVPLATQSTATYEIHEDYNTRPQIHHRFPHTTESNAHRPARYLHRTDDVLEVVGVKRTAPSSPAWETREAYHISAKRPRSVYRRSNLDGREYEPSHGMPSSHAHVVPRHHDVAPPVNPVEIVDLTSSPRVYQEARLRTIRPDDGHHRGLKLNEASPYRLGGTNHGSKDLPYDIPVLHPVHNQASIPAANLQRSVNGRQSNLPGGWYTDHTPDQSPTRKPRSTNTQQQSLLYKDVPNQSTMNPQLRPPKDYQRPQALNASLTPPLNSNTEPIVINDSPPKKKRRQAVDPPRPAAKGNRHGADSHNRPTARYRPVDLDQPQQLPGKCKNKNGIANSADQLCDLY